MSIRLKSLTALIAGCILGLSGCSTVESVTESVTGLIGGEVDNSIPPAELVDFEPTFELQELWSGRYGKGVENLYIQLIPERYEQHVFTADRDGRMIALDAETGDEIWSERDKRLKISGGPGAGSGLVVVGTSDAEVVARDAASGEEKWRTRVSSEVLAPPRIERSTVVIRTGDGKLIALDVNTGKRKWIYDRSIPTLTLRGTSPPIIFEGMVIAGFDNGRLVALDLESGKQIWEQRIAIPSGRSDLERMVDIDAEPAVHDGIAYVASFQASVAAVGVYDGQLQWTREISSHSVLAVDDERVYVTDSMGYVWALDRTTGSSIWKQEGLRARGVTGPALFDRYVIVGDYEGYLHWLDRSTGEFANRTQIDDERIIVPARSIGDSLLGFSSSGVLTAYRRE